MGSRVLVNLMKMNSTLLLAVDRILLYHKMIDPQVCGKRDIIGAVSFRLDAMAVR